ncbi:MAG: HD domain-containing protein [Planctomycetaceae bacterium]|jgi:GTP pyrophosphokinase|nr:HD domain-containing protein [Planctomycetaceae bacterium]
MTERFDEAIKLALQLHRYQKRKGREAPYISHLLRVAGLVMEFAGESHQETAEDTAIAAMLHDAVEDQGGLATAMLIREQFGERVERFVLACSDSATTQDQPKKRPWRERKEAAIVNIQIAEPESRLIIACDKLDNLRSMISNYRVVGEQLWKRFHAGRDDQLWYFRGMIDALRNAGNCPVMTELEDEIKKLENLIQESDEKTNELR